MTREKIVEHLAAFEAMPFRKEWIAERTVMQAAAAELRKTGSTCGRMTKLVGVQSKWCEAWRVGVPADGSCHCHRWEGKP